MSIKKKAWYKQKEYEKNMLFLTNQTNRKMEKAEKRKEDNIEAKKEQKTEEKKKKGLVGFLNPKKQNK